MVKGKDSQNWTEKHRVSKFDELKGQGYAVDLSDDGRDSP